MTRGLRGPRRRLQTGRYRRGGHFDGVWPRDLCFGARGIVAAGYGDVLADTADQLVAELADAETFYTDFHPSRNAATPAEGADTFPALVCLLAATGGLQAHADAIVSLAERHRERFVDERTGLVTAATACDRSGHLDQRRQKHDESY